MTFSATFFCEINFSEFESWKTGTLTYFEELNTNFVDKSLLEGKSLQKISIPKNTQF